jgi:hypothetical protein
VLVPALLWYSLTEYPFPISILPLLAMPVTERAEAFLSQLPPRIKLGEPGDPIIISLPLLLFPGVSATLLLRLSFVRGGVELPSLPLRRPECNNERGELGASQILSSGGGVALRKV